MARNLDPEGLTRTVEKVAEIARHSHFAEWFAGHLPDNLRPLLGEKAASPSSAVGEALGLTLSDELARSR